ncbi:hypothetical protein LZ554_005250 [Drepanopeziza brunnea f. sp. 'monogermtubi']|nr:hypothetical protein LZ554_005250 [Drepanopeziza brunnea f. sp. 'monogermtubi']
MAPAKTLSNYQQELPELVEDTPSTESTSVSEDNKSEQQTTTVAGSSAQPNKKAGRLFYPHISLGPYMFPQFYLGVHIADLPPSTNPYVARIFKVKACYFCGTIRLSAKGGTDEPKISRPVP